MSAAVDRLLYYELNLARWVKNPMCPGPSNLFRPALNVLLNLWERGVQLMAQVT
jgi:hypothetical protein